MKKNNFNIESIPNNPAANWEDAVYRPQIVTHYQGNPFIEALPDILSNKEAYDLMKFLPPFDPGARSLEDHLRVHFIYNLKSFFQPIGMHLRLETNFSLAIRFGYMGRNPLNRYYFQSPEKDLTDIKKKDPKYGKLKATSPSFYMVGFSGVGKSTGALASLLQYKPVIRHYEYQGQPLPILQIVWLHVDCPHDASLKGLCREIFEAIDDQLGTDYLGECGGGDTDDMIRDIRRLVRLHGIGCIVIDEIQQLSVAKGQGETNMLNFFVNLVNRSGVPIVLIGNPKALPLFTKEFQQARRASGIGDIKWGAMPYFPNDEEDEWKVLFEKIWKYQYLKNQVPLTDEFLSALHIASAGIIDFAIKAFILAQFRAIETKTEILTPNLILSVAADNFSFSQSLLQILRTNDFKAMSKVPDLNLFDLDTHYDQFIARMSQRSLKDIIRSEREGLSTTRGAAIQPDGSQSLHPKGRRRGRISNKEKLKQLVDQKSSSGDLRVLYANATAENKSFSELLTEVGYAKPVDEFLS